MGLLFAFFLIGLPLAAGVAELMLLTGRVKNDELLSKIGGYTPQYAAPAVKHRSPVTETQVMAPPPALPSSTTDIAQDPPSI